MRREDVVFAFYNVVLLIGLLFYQLGYFHPTPPLLQPWECVGDPTCLDRDIREDV